MTVNAFIDEPDCDQKSTWTATPPFHEYFQDK